MEREQHIKDFNGISHAPIKKGRQDLGFETRSERTAGPLESVFDG